MSGVVGALFLASGCATLVAVVVAVVVLGVKRGWFARLRALVRPTASAPASAACPPAPVPPLPLYEGCDYVRRSLAKDGTRYCCPPGFLDTGYDWKDGEVRGELQCVRVGCTSQTVFAACTKPAVRAALVPGCKYAKRVWRKGRGWCCPPGSEDTGYDWADGADVGGKQCVVGTCKAAPPTPPPPTRPPPTPPPPTRPPPTARPPPVRPWCKYVRRVQAGKAWKCPRGFVDTGYDWKDGAALGEKQCVAAACPAVAPAPPTPRASAPPPAPGLPPVRAWCKYVRRVPVGQGWTCPQGFVATGYDWKDGAVLGEKQCVASDCPAVAPIRPWCKYVRRVQAGKAWKCPRGYDDTGHDWQDGAGVGDKQCVASNCPLVAPPLPVLAQGGGAGAPAGGLAGPAAVGARMVPQTAQQQLGLDAEQVSNILSMINGPEQSTASWWKRDDGSSVFGYCQNIGDGRGCTIGIAGFTTQGGKGDAYGLFGGFGRVPGGSCTCGSRSSGCAMCQEIRGLAGDARWVQAQWDQYSRSYFSDVQRLCPRGFSRAVTKGLLLDTAMNAGLGDDSSRNWGLDHLVREASRVAGGDEGAFVRAFADLRIRYPTKNSADVPKRVRAWLNVLERNPDMRGDISPLVYIP